MTSARVRAVGVLVTLAALAGLTACSPADKPVLAVRVVDGQPALVLAECAEFTADRISVYTVDVTPAERWTIDRDGGGEVRDVTFFAPPTGWTADEQTLTAFEPDTEYSVAAYGDRHNAVPVHFTLAEVTGLGPEQVLTGGTAGKRKAVTETAFRDKAKKAC
ncbi:hypothetical protein [Micromonospora sp. WMMD964]|uniref:hypothetical protein n=1 Tax=Micromonospora sp. WMMD964 TaxID=3016091 RepID=UPI00249A426F|nr:hypothetical protein [Micromonospora sp. WMMD964]WFF03242.1 hypothetical protein O7616_11025 [Micromonospora sp. WMMD964]